MSLDADKAKIDATTPGIGAGVAALDRRVCITCGYALRGLAGTSPCPECGATLAASLWMPMLPEASPEHLRRVADGLHLLVIGLAGGLVLVPLGGFLVWSALATRPAEPWCAILFALGWLVWTIVLAAGCRRYTTTDAAHVHETTRWPGRQTILVTTCLTLAFAVLGVGIALLRSDPDLMLLMVASAWAGSAAPAALVVVLIPAGIVCWSLWFFGLARYTLWMSRRVPDARAVGWTQRLMWVVPLTVLGSAVLMWLTNEALFEGVFPLFTPRVVSTVVCVEGGLLWMLIVLVRLRSQVRALIANERRIDIAPRPAPPPPSP